MMVFLKSPLGRYLIIGAVFLLVVGSIYGKGRGDGRAAERAAEASREKAARAKVAKRETQAADITEKVKTGLEKTRTQIEYRTRYLIKEVPANVPPAADARCIVPVGFVWLHDAAAFGDPTNIPGPARGPVEAPSGVPLSAVSATVVANYGIAYDWRAEAVAWREWYGRQKAEWERR